MTLTLSLRPDVTVLAVLVPEGANNFKFVHWDGINVVFNIGDRVGFVDISIHVGYARKDKEAEWYPHEIVGLLREVKDDVLSELLVCQDSVLGPGLVFWSYSSESFTCPTAQSSMKGAIYKAGGDPELNWLILKKI